MSFNDFCKYLKDKMNFCVCDNPHLISYIEKKVVDYRTRIEDYNFWHKLYEESKSA